MRVTTRQRHYPDGRAVWTADIHVAPAGSQEPERFRVTAPPTVATRSGAERWAMDQARQIAAEGRPRNTRRAREMRAQREAAARATYVPTLAEFWPVFVEFIHAERRKPNTIESYTSAGRRKLLPIFGTMRLDPVRILQDRVTSVNHAFHGFLVQCAGLGGSAMARKIILATGVTDALPAIPGLSEVWGKSVWPCPYCDAWEVRGQPLGVLGQDGADLAVLLRTWSKDIIYFTNNTPMTADDEAKLRAINIPIVRVGVRSLESTGGILHRVWMMSGGYIDRRALFIKSALRQRSDLAVQLGLQERGSDVIRHGPRGDTTVPGVYIAGDTSQEHFFAITAAAAGANVGVAVNEELHREDIQRWRG